MKKRLVFVCCSIVTSLLIYLKLNRWGFVYVESEVECVGSSLNQSSLFKNIFYFNKTFWILTTKKSSLPLANVRVGPWIPTKLIPERRRFYSQSQFIDFLRQNHLNPTYIRNVTIYFDQLWLSNIGHALFDGLYPAYLALIRFPPRHLRPFTILLSTIVDSTNTSFTYEVYRTFSGLEIRNFTEMEENSFQRSFVFEELIIGSGNMCQRCLQPDLQLPGGIHLNGSALFRQRMYHKYNLTFNQKKKQTMNILIIHNKRFTDDEKNELLQTIDEIHVRYPSIQIEYLDFQSNKSWTMKEHLELISRTNIHVSGPGTGQMYQTFLSDGSVHINLGAIHSRWNFTSFMEQYMAAGTPYIKAIYYPIQQRTQGIQKEIVIQLIEQALQLIQQDFHIPVEPNFNLAPDGQLFVEMCSRDRLFCQTVTHRWENQHFECVNTWPEEIINEVGPWSTRNSTCFINRTLLKQLKLKFNLLR